MSDASEMALHLQDLFAQVEEDSYSRHDAGAKQYGPLNFLRVDTLEMLYEELLDGINYLRYTAVKVKLLQEALAQQAAPLVESDTTGGEGFISTSEFMKGFRKE